MDVLMNTFSIYDYHWFWYLLGFLAAPRITLAVLFSVYCPVAIGWKIAAWFIAIATGVRVGNNSCSISTT